MKNISGLTITEHQNSKRIVNIQINDEILDKLIFPFNKFDITGSTDELGTYKQLLLFIGT